MNQQRYDEGQVWGPPDGLREHRDVGGAGAEDEAPTVRLRRMRGLTLVWAWLLVHRERLAAGARRHGPRALRGARRAGRWTAHQAAGVVVALGVALWLWGVPLAASAAASPLWSRAATVAAGWLRRRQITLGGLALIAVGLLLGPGSLLGAPALLVGLGWASVRIAMIGWRHTPRGRVRAGYGAVPVPGVRTVGVGGVDDGFAGFWELRRHLSAHAARQVAAATRPSLTEALPHAPSTAVQVRQVGPGVAAASRARRLAHQERWPVTECGTWLGRSTVGPVRGTDCWAPHRDVVGLYAPPQTGKTALLGHHIIDHPGSLVSTSTKVELYLRTATLRAERGRVRLFNPQTLGGLLSTLRWSPTAGCARGATARQRAGHMVGAARPAGGDDAGMWQEWATSVLAALLMAADRGGRSMADVAHWVFTQKTGAETALELLREAAGTPVPPLVVDALSQVTTTEAKKTRDAIFMTMRAAVGFMADPAVAAVCCPTPDDEVLDVAAFIAGRESLYLVGAKDGEVAPLLAALTGHLFETAKVVSADYPGERLDPPLRLVLDEVALITPVPLPAWLADAGGRGIAVEWAAQSPSQLAETWGERGARTIEDCTNTLVVYGGLKDDHDLERISRLCGQRQEIVHDPDADGPGRPRLEWRPVVPSARVRTLPQGHLLVVHRTTRPTITRFTPYEHRRDVRRTARPGPAATPRCPNDRSAATASTGTTSTGTTSTGTASTGTASTGSTTSATRVPTTAISP